MSKHQIEIEPTKTTVRCHECNCFLYLGCRRRLFLFVDGHYSDCVYRVFDTFQCWADYQDSVALCFIVFSVSIGEK